MEFCCMDIFIKAFQRKILMMLRLFIKLILMIIIVLAKFICLKETYDHLTEAMMTEIKTTCVPTTSKKSISSILRFRYRSYLPHLTILPGGFEEYYDFLLNNINGLLESQLNEMKFEINRLKSFANAPEQNVFFTKLAANGFFYDSIRKSCRCAFCGFEKERWTNNDDVSEVHQRGIPSCPFLNNRYFSGNVPMHSRSLFTVSQAVAHRGRASSFQPRYHRKLCGTITQQRRTNIPQQRSDAFNDNTTSLPTRDLTDTANTEPENNERLLQDVEHAESSGLENEVIKRQGEGRGSVVEDSPTSRLKIYNPKHAEFDDKESRKSTFNGWREDISQTPEMLADAGFFFTGVEDIVRCYYCDGGLRNWETGDDPWEEHARWFPFCKFVIKKKGREYIESIRRQTTEHQPTEDFARENNHTDDEKASQQLINQLKQLDEDINSPIDRYEKQREHARHSPTCWFLFKTKEEGVGQTSQSAWKQIYKPKHAQLEEKDSRLHTYQEWRSDVGQTPELLADAGFFYTGEEDIVRCHYCDGGLRNWEPGDDPWEEHARWFPSCKFVMKKGREYIENIRRQTTEQRELQEDVSNTSRETTDPEFIGQTNVELIKELICIRCKTNTSCMVFFGCGHRVTCETCAYEVDFCPHCNAKINSRIKTYLS